MKHLKLSLLFIALTVFIGCSSDDDSSSDEEDDIEQLVENFVTPELLQVLEDFGFDFNDGQDTPDILGNYLFNPVQLVATNIPNDLSPGATFLDIQMSFSNLNPQNRTFDFELMENGNETGQAQASFYSGNGNDFTAYVRTLFTIDGNDAIVLYAISGTIADEGITNATYALIMLDNMGNPNNVYIENGQGRLFEDGNGTATAQ